MKARNVVSAEEIQEAILKHPGAFVTPKRIYRKFSSQTRPDGDTVKSQMIYLQEISLGTFQQVQRSDFFFKVTPAAANTEALANFGISLEEYAAHFRKTDDGLTDSQREAAIENHPHGDAYDEYLTSQSGIIQSDRR